MKTNIIHKLGMIIMIPCSLAAQNNTFPASGNVGIGTTTPEAALHVAKNNFGGSGGTLFLDNQASSTVGNATEIAFSNDIGGSYSGVSGSRIKSITQDAYTGAADLTFTTWNGTVEAEKMRITSNGCVGIGTNNPAYTLTVNGIVRANQFSTEGDWGVGTTTPEAALHVAKDNFGGSCGTLFLDNQASSTVGNATEIAFSNDIGGSYSGVSGSRIKSITQDAYTGAADLTFTTWNGTVEAEKMRITSNGCVGIGTNNPAYTLTVNGIVRANQFSTEGDWGVGTTTPEAALHVAKNNFGGSGGTLFLDNQASSTVGNATEIAFSNDIGGSYSGVSGSRIKSITQDAYTGAADLTFATWNGTVEAEKMRITSNGCVGIGTNNPTHALTVNGPVRATQFIANVNAYADYVFKPGYEAMPLLDIEKSIKLHGHLPGIPNETEVRNKGMDIANTVVALLRKVEELTLYSIEHQKAIDAQRIEIARLSSENKALQEKLCAGARR